MSKIENKCKFARTLFFGIREALRNGNFIIFSECIANDEIGVTVNGTGKFHKSALEYIGSNRWKVSI